MQADWGHFHVPGSDGSDHFVEVPWSCDWTTNADRAVHDASPRHFRPWNAVQLQACHVSYR